MMELIEANWPLLLAALLIGIAVAWFVFVASRKTRVTGDKRDVLDEGAERAGRNQALIDSPPVVPRAPIANPAVTTGLAGAGTAVAAAVEEQHRKAAEENAADTGTPDEDHSGDDLTRIKGIGPKLASTLGSMGVTRFDQIARWSEEDIDRIDAQLGRFQGRIRRDNWAEQAKLLSAGDSAAYEERFGRL